jgi:hypothetical protein
MAGNYSAEISRKNPGCILFLLDQSQSMNDSFAGDPATAKKDAAADAINKLITSIIVRCTQNIDEGPRPYFDVGVIGYGARGIADFCFGGKLKGRGLVSIPDLAANQLKVLIRNKKVSDGAGGLVETQVRFPVWFEAKAENSTPMAEAVRLATRTLTPWTRAHRQSYPPIVINITDGEPNVDPSPEVRKLAKLETSDGNVLLYNLHLSHLASTAIAFPGSASELADEYARMLFNMSSELPLKIREELAAENMPVVSAARGFIFNTDAVALIQFLDIGTRVAAERMTESYG